MEPAKMINSENQERYFGFKVFKVFSGLSFILGWGLSFWATLTLFHWWVPDEQTASPARRLLGEWLFIPVLLILAFGLMLALIILAAQTAKWLKIKTPPNVEPPYSQRRRGQAGLGTENPKSETAKPPAAWPYWIMAVICWGAYGFFLFVIVQQMLSKPITFLDWFLLFLFTAILAAPGVYWILRIQQIRRGEPLEKTSTAPKPLPLAWRYGLAGFGAVLFLTLFSYSIWKTHEFLKTARPATGVVTRWIHHGTGRGSYTRVEVRFATPNGVSHTLESQNESGFLTPSVGQAVPLLYNPNNLEDYRVDQFTEIWAGPLKVLFLAVLMVVGGIIGVLRRR